MMRNLLLISLLAATATAAEIPVAKVADDAKAIDRVAAASKRDMPHDLLKRIVNDDIELLRGHRSDGTYEYAGFERFESGRNTQSYSVQPRDEKLEIRGSFVYRLQIESPSRRMVVTRNRKIYLDRAELEYIPIDRGATQKTQSVKIDVWIEPGQSKSIDFDAIAKQATVRVFARADKASGYGNLVLSLIQARVFDNNDSPYADAVASAKAILRALDHDDVPSIRAMATRMYNDLVPTAGPAPKSVEVTAERTVDPEIYTELQAIEDLLTGTDAERRQGLDRLHQLVRKLRAQPH
ncbi:MAG TPA: hypothetical protein VII12_18310 [Thermoanaerobaculia bacterium]